MTEALVKRLSVSFLVHFYWEALAARTRDWWRRRQLRRAARLADRYGFVVVPQATLTEARYGLATALDMLGRSGWLWDGTPGKLHLRRRLRPIAALMERTATDLYGETIDPSSGYSAASHFRMTVDKAIGNANAD